MKVKNISPKLSARANYTFSGMTILQHKPAAAPKKVFLPCVSLPRANFYENIFYNAFAPSAITIYQTHQQICCSDGSNIHLHSTCRDRPRFKQSIPRVFQRSVKKNSQHVQTKTFIGVQAFSTCRDRPRFKQSIPRVF